MLLLILFDESSVRLFLKLVFPWLVADNVIGVVLVIVVTPVGRYLALLRRDAACIFDLTIELSIKLNLIETHDSISTSEAEEEDDIDDKGAPVPEINVGAANLHGDDVTHLFNLP